MSDFRAGMMHKIVRPMKIGGAEIVHDSPSPIERMRARMHGMPLDCETYTRLLINGRVWMTDAEYEWRTNLGAVRQMQGDVLIAGLGVGFIIAPLLKKESVTSITVIERNADVIKIVSPQFPNVKIVEADAREWMPPKKSFDCVYLDIWADVPNSDDWEDIKMLKKKYRSALRKGGWIAGWCEHKAKP